MRKIAEGEPVDMDAGAEAAPEGEAGAEDVTIEDVAAALQQLVESGALTPEVAQEVLQRILGGGEGAAGAAPEAAAAPAAAPAGMEQQASIQDLGKKAAAALAKK
jgi:hypothetical protein